MDLTSYIQINKLDNLEEALKYFNKYSSILTDINKLKELGVESTSKVSFPHIWDLLNAKHEDHIHNLFVHMANHKPGTDIVDYLLHFKNFLGKLYLFYTSYMNLSLILFLIGVLGFVLNRKNIILMLISIEIMLLAITFLILIASLNFDDILGQIYATYIISIAGAESAIGLGILVAFYRLRGSIAIEFK